MTRNKLSFNLKLTIFFLFRLRCAMKGPGPYRAAEVFRPSNDKFTFVVQATCLQASSIFRYVLASDNLAKIDTF